FGLTQNCLSDGGYLNYLRRMYGDKLDLPTPDDLRQCINDYRADIQKRVQEHRLEPGEHVSFGKNGKVEVSGMIAIEHLRASMARMIFDRNTNKEFYIEESFPYDWMYSCLEPHGLIFRINPEPLAELSPEIVHQDHDYWTKIESRMIGDWLNDDTPVQDVAAFAEKVYLRHDFSGFNGDSNFVLNAYSHRMFSKERQSIAGLYAWRAQHAVDAADEKRMDAAADFACRQAWGLCPDSPVVVFQYTAFLMTEKRYSDALVVAETAAKFRSGEGESQFDQLIAYLKRYSKTP
ncbi:MAG: hypothetical protein ACREE6_01125, partial [Limisphaerales bacterium]